MKAAASFWKIGAEENYRYTVQIEIPKYYKYIAKLEKAFGDWLNSGVGFDPRNGSKIMIFSKDCMTPAEWEEFRNAWYLDEMIYLKEVE